MQFGNILYKFELVHNVAEDTKRVCCTKGEDAIDISKVARLFKKLRSDYWNLTDQARFNRPAIVDSNAVPEAIEANPVSNI